MKIKSTVEYLGKSYQLIYQDTDDFSQLPYKDCKQAYGVCFYKNKIVLGFSRRMQKWSLVGGTIEHNETLEQALKREIQEESNMRILKCWPIGYQTEVGKSNYQLRYACVVEPYGPFRADPDAGEHYGVDRITLVKPEDFNKYINWGKIGERLLERALEIINSQKL